MTKLINVKKALIIALVISTIAAVLMTVSMIQEAQIERGVEMERNIIEMQQNLTDNQSSKYRIN